MLWASLTPLIMAKTSRRPGEREGTRFSMVMSMIDHVIHHKMQLYTYLKLLGHKLGSMELYYGIPSGTINAPLSLRFRPVTAYYLTVNPLWSN